MATGPCCVTAHAESQNVVAVAIIYSNKEHAISQSILQLGIISYSVSNKSYLEKDCWNHTV